MSSIGGELILDFFLDGSGSEMPGQSQAAASEAAPSGSSSSAAAATFSAIQDALNEEVVQNIGGIFAFDLKGTQSFSA